MFIKCFNITEINLSNFNASKVTNMVSMFYNCSSLTSLDLSNFNTSQVTSMYCMFYKCSSLTSLDLSNFCTLQVTNMVYMFGSCANLEYINLNNFVETKLSSYNNMFNNVPGNVVICINESHNVQKILSKITNKKCLVIDCSRDWKSKQKKLINNNNNECIESCDNSSQYMNIMENAMIIVHMNFYMMKIIIK